jgi:hypothetical protein
MVPVSAAFRPDGEPGATLLIARKGGAVVRPSPQPQQAMV